MSQPTTSTTGAQDEENPLAPNAVLSTILQVLAPAASEGSGQLKSPADLTMALFHSAMLRSGFRFLGIGEERHDRVEPADGQETPSPLPTDWNASGDMFSFRYKHSQSSLTFLLKGVKVGKKLVVHGMAIEDETLRTIELSLPTFISPGFTFPFKAPSESSSSEGGPLADAFASPEQLHELLREFRVKIVQKLIPGLNKPGYEEWKSQ
ncbi:hypothetical protein HKX48_009579, partial [Thoreauomyces humboldtii]